MRFDAMGSPTFLRRALAAVIVVDLISLYFFIGDALTRSLGEGLTLPTFTELLSRPFVRGTLVAMGVVAAAVFSHRAGRLLAGLLALLVLTLLNTVHAELFGSPWRHLYYSGLCLLGWLLGLAVTRWRGAASDESYACVGSTALLGAAYFNSGISKLVFGGAVWVSGLPIQAVVVAQDGMVSDGWLTAYRTWVAATPVINALFSSATIILELAGPLLIGGRWMRAVVAFGLIAMHLNILVLTHILYWEAMVFLALFGLLRHEPAVEIAARTHRPKLLEDRAFAVSAVLLVVVGLIGIANQSRRFASWYRVDSAEGVGPSTAVATGSTTAPRIETHRETGERRADSVIAVQEFGPFTVGQSVTAGWSIHSLELNDDSFVALLDGRPGRVRFEISCSPSPYRSPFDIGPVHIFFGKEAAFEDVVEAGGALRDRLLEVGEGPVLCDRLKDWGATARAANP